MSKSRVAVTGATGFVGSYLLRELQKRGDLVLVVGRHPATLFAEDSAKRAVGRSHPTFLPVDLAHPFDVTDSLRGIDTIFHLAARAHVMKESDGSDGSELYRRMNLDATEHLARQARAAGVRRFLFLSSVKAVGEATLGSPWTETTEPHPADPYGKTKLAAENRLKEICRDGTFGNSMTYTILRSPLVYGPGVKANFLQLIKLVDKKIPLPFALVQNHRSLVGLPNLVSALLHCAQDERAANQTFFVADPVALSTGELIGQIASSLHRKPVLVPLPQWTLHLLGKMTKQHDKVRRLTGDLELDISRIQKVAGWSPPFTTANCLAETIAWYQTK